MKVSRELIEAIRKARERIESERPVFLSTERKKFIVLDALERPNDVLFLVHDEGNTMILQCFKRGLEEKIKGIVELIKEGKLVEVEVDYIGARVQYINEFREYNGNLNLELDSAGIVSGPSSSGSSIWIDVLDKNGSVTDRCLALCQSVRTSRLINLPVGTSLAFIGNRRLSSRGYKVIDLMYYEVVEVEGRGVEEASEVALESQNAGVKSEEERVERTSEDEWDELLKEVERI
ncbi:hypothetical protein DRO30_05020 [Candidatus Bathyarchaeota archaeon]|nr:MAG: hypothetical protein DRO30_05020 [Candidatus Bathyarchaeota archaeon]